MRRILVGTVLLVLSISAGAAQQLLVFPAVTDEVPGEDGSLWVTVVRVVKVDPHDDVTIRRIWTCLPGGGHIDEPPDAPSWDLPARGDDYYIDRLLQVRGHDLLVGSGSAVGAVALRVEGGDVLAHSHVLDVTRGVDLPPVGARGLGQLIPAVQSPLSGPSHIPWLGGCSWVPCSDPPPVAVLWEHMRNNIGLVNPNPEPLTITASVIPFSSSSPPNSTNPAWQLPSQETFTKHIPAYGWVQFHWQSDATYGEDPTYGGGYIADLGFVINLAPDKDLPYYAYASVVFSPDPTSGVPAFSDPMYVPAEPGYIKVGWEDGTD
jgi:hypothetical protein